MIKDELFENDCLNEADTPQPRTKAGKKMESVDSAGGHSSIFYLHSMFLFCGRILDKTLDFYNGLFDIGPREKAKIYRNISIHYANKGLYEKSLEYLKEWTRLDAKNPDSHYQLGISLAASGNQKSALNAFNKVIAMSPKHKGAMFRKASLQVKIKDYEGAVEILESLVNQLNDNARVYYLLSVAYEGLDNIDKAIENLTKAIELDPDEIKFHQHLGFLNVRKDDHQTAAKSFTKVMELEREREQDEEDY